MRGVSAGADVALSGTPPKPLGAPQPAAARGLPAGRALPAAPGRAPAAPRDVRLQLLHLERLGQPDHQSALSARARVRDRRPEAHLPGAHVPAAAGADWGLSVAHAAWRVRLRCHETLTNSTSLNTASMLSMLSLCLRITFPNPLPLRTPARRPGYDRAQSRKIEVRIAAGPRPRQGGRVGEMGRCATFSV
eukprot:1424284-Prymnesium_polylepis.1